jgi:hypothetical protein
LQVDPLDFGRGVDTAERTELNHQVDGLVGAVRHDRGCPARLAHHSTPRFTPGFKHAPRFWFRRRNGLAGKASGVPLKLGAIHKAKGAAPSNRTRQIAVFDPAHHQVVETFA